VRDSLREKDVNVNFDGPVDKMAQGSLLLHSQITMKTYLKGGYIRDTPTQNVPCFQLHYKNNLGIILSLYHSHKHIKFMPIYVL
jgi:hypothetical protein